MTANLLEIETNMTLHKMLDEIRKIEVPIIQRDYAQGRKNVKEIRNDFLKDIFTHLKRENSMKLSFVYGTKNETIYVPYDGQQRLTLVYLITLYLAAYCENWKSIRTLSRFSYYTRDYATAFCDFLTSFESDYEEGKKNVFQRINVHSKDKIDELIKNDSGFFGSWQYEPTVASMLVVLQAIHEEFDNVCEKRTFEERMELAQKFLTAIESGKIFFDWCPIQASDNIYIKMNGRGKPLSAFDNFKNTLYSELSKLRKHAQENGKLDAVNFLRDFEVKMDGPWTELFWQKRNSFGNEENYDIAPYMMNFLYYIFEYRHYLSCESFFFGGKESFKWIDEKNVVTFLTRFKELCGNDTTEKRGHITIEDYVWASKILDILVARLQTPGIDIMLGIDSYLDEENLFKEIASHSGRVASSRTVIVATMYYEYLINISEFDEYGKYVGSDVAHRDEWLELTRRLIKTAAKFKARYDALIRDKHILVGLSKKLIPVLFSNNKSGDLCIGSTNVTDAMLRGLKKYFDASHVYSQLAEEICKFRLINENEKQWKPLLMQAENELSYFENMIYFLISMSRDKSGKIMTEYFAKYLGISKLIFDANGVINQNKFSAILLSIADYRIASGEGYSNSLSLCSNESTEAFSWRSFFDVLEGEMAEKKKNKIDVIREAFELVATYGEVDKAYDALKKNTHNPDWKGLIICYPDVLKEGSKHRIVFQDGANWFLIRSEGVVKQVHANSLYDSTNLQLYGLYKEAGSCKAKFQNTMIDIGNGNCIRKEGKDYTIIEAGVRRIVAYDDALAYLKAL